MGNDLRIVLAAGGTAGHIEPALNLADALCAVDPAIDIRVIGGERGLESTLVPSRGFQLSTVASAPLPRRLSMDLLRVVPNAMSARKAAMDILREHQTDVVVGFGGYAALPTYLAARKLRIPLVIHEANARPGLANRVGARLTKHVFTSVPGSLSGAEVMGLPLRLTIAGLDRRELHAQARAHFGLEASGPVLLVFGGSQGATHLNAVIEASVEALTSAGIQILHSYGANNSAPQVRPGYVAVPYLERMDLAYSAADLAIARAGAMTCAELAAVGLAAVYVPLPIGNGEQRLNASGVVQAGGGLLVDNAQFTSQWLLTQVPGLLHDEARLAAMGAAAASHGVRDAGDRLALAVRDIALTGRKERP